MHKFLIYLSIYFRLTFFCLSVSPSSEAGVHLWRGSSLLGMVYTCLLRWANRKTETRRAEVNR
jgi:hypothetical protein